MVRVLFPGFAVLIKLHLFSREAADSEGGSSTVTVRVSNTAISSPASSLPPTPDAPSDKRKRRATKTDELLILACQHLPSSPKEQDEFDIFRRNIVAKLRELAKLNNMQRIIAEKLVSDVIFYGQFQTLTCIHSCSCGQYKCTCTTYQYHRSNQ